MNTQTVKIVAEQEIRTRLRQKSFLISALVLVLAAVGGVVAMYFLQDRAQEYDVAVVDTSAAAVVEKASTVLEADDAKANVEQVSSLDEAEGLVEDGSVDAALVDQGGTFQLVADSEVDPQLAAAVSIAVQDQIVAVDQRLLDPNADESGEREGVAFIMVLLFFGVAVTFGMMIAQGVTVEKESRVVEILAAAIPLRDLLWGKVIANTLLALGQVVVTVVAAVVTMWATGLTGLLDVVTGVAWWYVAFFVLGFVALAGVWAVAGSMAARQQDLSATTTPVMIMLFVPYFASTLGNDTIVNVLSLVPISSAMVMPARLAVESVPLWQTLTALGLNVVATVVLVRLAAKAYEMTVMRTERVTGFKELLRR